jgi:hypothetical protein
VPVVDGGVMREVEKTVRVMRGKGEEWTNLGSSVASLILIQTQGLPNPKVYRIKPKAAA